MKAIDPLLLFFVNQSPNQAYCVVTVKTIRTASVH